MTTWHTTGIACVVMSLGQLCALADDGRQAAFTLVPDDHGMLLKAPDERTVLRYMTTKPADTELTANSVCCLYPVNTPSGEGVVEFAPSDHRHHRGVFLAWHSITGRQKADFWGWGAWAPTEEREIRNRSVALVAADAEHAALEVRNDWLAEDQPMIGEALSIVVRERSPAWVIDLDYRLTPTQDVTIDQTAFGGLCVKGRKDGTATYVGPDGEVTLPNPHHLKPESDWPSAAWYDYSVALEAGRTVGVAVLDHPGNPPTAWHNLAPIAMMNPCIVARGPVQMREGEPLRLRYRLVVHDGPPPVEVLAALAEQWREQ